MNLIIFYDHSKDILNIVNKYKNVYNASVYEIKTNELVTLKDKIASSYFNKPINVFRCNLNLLNYENIIYCYRCYCSYTSYNYKLLVK